MRLSCKPRAVSKAPIAGLKRTGNVGQSRAGEPEPHEAVRSAVVEIHRETTLAGLSRDTLASKR
jgi:hypothetical protein